MSFAKKMARKIKKQANKGDKRAVREYRQARQSVKESMVKQLERDHKCRKQARTRLMACFLLVMHECYGFGRERLLKLRDKMQSEFDAIVAGNVSIEEIVEYLDDNLNVDIGIAAENPDAGHYRQIEFRVVQELSSAFLMALLDEFGFKKKRLEKAYGYVAGLSEMLDRNEITYSEIFDKVDRVINKGKGAENNHEKY